MTSYFPTWFVPSETSSISVAQTSSLPAMFDVSPYNGDPDRRARGAGQGRSVDTESASYAPTGGSVSAGFWNAGPTSAVRTPGGALGHRDRLPGGDD